MQRRIAACHARLASAPKGRTVDRLIHVTLKIKGVVDGAIFVALGY